MRNNQYQNIIDEMTVEECIRGIEKLDICCNRAEVVREKAKQLLEKHIPQKPIWGNDDMDMIKCPTCGYDLDCVDAGDYLQKQNYCPECGQSLDWSDVE